MCYLTWLNFSSINSLLIAEHSISPPGLSESHEHVSTSKLDAVLSGCALIDMQTSVLLQFSALESLSSIWVSAVNVQFQYPIFCILVFVFSFGSAFLSSPCLMNFFIWYGCAMKGCSFSNAVLSLARNAVLKCSGKTLFLCKVWQSNVFQGLC